MRCTAWIAVLTLVPACFNPDDPAVDTDGADSDASTGPTSGNADATDAVEPDTAGTTVVDPDTLDDPSMDGATEVGAVCGDGNVEGSEVCDDGVNDGAYGGCLADCSAAAGSCGDGEINGPETCDDALNDGSYGSCTAQCTPGPSCGDGELNGPELCDNGSRNANGSGCNVDCVTSGLVVGEYLEDGLAFCDGAFTTPPQFNDAQDALVSATGYCGGDTQLLVELDPAVEVVQTFDVLLPQTPMESAAMIGGNWLLEGGSCNYVIAADAAYTEICETDRNNGPYGLSRVDDANYLALDYQILSWFGPGSPAVGDTPVWTRMVTDNATFDYTSLTAITGPNSSAIIAGSRRQVANNNTVAYFTQYTAAGNLVDENTYAAISRIDQVALAPDDSLLLYAYEYPDGVLIKLNAAFGVDWTLGLTNPGDVQIAFDSAGDIVVLQEDGQGNGSYNLRKLSPAAGAQRWSTAMPEVGNNARLSVAPDDAIWVAAPGYGVNGGQLWVGRVSP